MSGIDDIKAVTKIARILAPLEQEDRCRVLSFLAEREGLGFRVLYPTLDELENEASAMDVRTDGAAR